MLQLIYTERPEALARAVETVLRDVGDTLQQRPRMVATSLTLAMMGDAAITMEFRRAVLAAFRHVSLAHFDCGDPVAAAILEVVGSARKLPEPSRTWSAVAAWSRLPLGEQLRLLDLDPPRSP